MNLSLDSRLLVPMLVHSDSTMNRENNGVRNSERRFCFPNSDSVAESFTVRAPLETRG